MEWVNRVGIILNFIAGFLLAPEIIGLERLKKINDYLNNKVEITRVFIITKIKETDQINRVLLKNVRVLFYLLILFFECTFIFYFIRLATILLSRDTVSIYVFFDIKDFTSPIFVTILIILVGIAYYAIQLQLSDNSRKSIIIVLLLSLSAVGIILLSPIILIITLSFVTLGIVILKIIQYTVKILEEKRGFRTILVSLGLTLYIIGNILQFLATF